jgi:hypothetical protein
MKSDIGVSYTELPSKCNLYALFLQSPPNMKLKLNFFYKI